MWVRPLDFHNAAQHTPFDSAETSSRKNMTAAGDATASTHASTQASAAVTCKLNEQPLTPHASVATKPRLYTFQSHQDGATPPYPTNGHSHGHSHGHAHQHGAQCSHDHGHGVSGRTMDTGAAASVPTARELTPLDELFLCAKTNNIARFREIIGEQRDTATASAMVQQRDSQGHTLTHWIAQRGSAEFVELAHELGAPLNLPSEDAVKLHPIHWACSTGNLTALKAFVRLGVDINTTDDTKQRTPLLIAAQNGFPLLVMYCVKRGADINLVDVDEDSAIHWAAYKGATEIVSVFQYLGLSTDRQDRYGQTPLHLAAMRGEFATVQYLVEELESDLSVEDAQGRTPLQLATLKGYGHVASYLSRRSFRAKWNVFAWWESSRAPFYFVLANIPLSLLAYVRLVTPYMPELRGLYVTHMMWNAMTWAFFVQTKRTSPGDISKAAEYRDEYSRVTEELVHGSERSDANLCLLERPLCHSCHIQRPLRSKHCRVCKTCIHTFDHHCPFVDNCIGRGNYVAFMGFVGGLLVDLLMMQYVFYLQWCAHGATWWMGFGVVYCAVMLLPVTHLFGFHCYLTAKNLTTNEVMNSHRYQYLRTEHGAYRNPFDHGLLRNCADRCLPEYVSTDGSSGHDDGELEERHRLTQSKHADVVSAGIAALPV